MKPKRELTTAAKALVQAALLGSEAETDVDRFGASLALRRRAVPLLDWLVDTWFRVRAEGFEELPSGERLLFVANRAGLLPWDSLILGHVAARHGISLRPLLEDSVYYLPYAGLLANRLGAVRASPENATHLLEAGEAVAVFPEGARGYSKLYRDRYRLQRFGRGGFVRLALRTGARIVPTAIVGSEETMPLLGKLDGGLLGLPFLPVTPTFPWLGPIGLVPLPAPWTIRLGPVLRLEHGAEAADDDPLVLRVTEEVREHIQSLLADTRPR